MIFQSKKDARFFPFQDLKELKTYLLIPESTMVETHLSVIDSMKIIFPSCLFAYYLFAYLISSFIYESVFRIIIVKFWMICAFLGIRGTVTCLYENSWGKIASQFYFLNVLFGFAFTLELCRGCCCSLSLIFIFSSFAFIYSNFGAFMCGVRTEAQIVKFWKASETSPHDWFFILKTFNSSK
jgi:hypothetical protein